MTFHSRRRHHRPLLFLFLFLLCSGTGISQQREPTSEHLVKLLIDPSEIQAAGGPTFSCGPLHEQEARLGAVADSLIARGAPALPAINAALDKLESGEIVANWGTGTLLYAFARIDGMHSLARLRKLTENSRLQSVQMAISQAIAVSLNLTSYVTSSTRPSVLICQSLSPRSVVDQFILAWERHDLVSLEKALGPDARATLKTLVGRGAWPSLQEDVYPRKDASPAAVGYQIDIGGDAAAERGSGEHLTLGIRFTDNIGSVCGQMQIEFIRNPGSIPALGQMPYLINNSNLRDLIVLVAKCSGRA